MLLSDDLYKNLSKIHILSNQHETSTLKRALIRYSNESLFDSLREIFLNLLRGSLTVSDIEAKELIGSTTRGFTGKVVSSSPAQLKAYLLGGTRTKHLETLTFILSHLVEQLNELSTQKLSDTDEDPLPVASGADDPEDIDYQKQDRTPSPSYGRTTPPTHGHSSAIPN